MVFISGQENYGKVDVVSNLFYVATRFFHLYYVPVIPLATYVIVAGTEKGETFQGMKIPMSWKSILAAWVRTVLIVCVLFGVFKAFVAGIEAINGLRGRDSNALTVSLSLCVISIFGFWLTKRTSRASYQRAHELGQKLNIPPETINQALGVEPDLNAAEAVRDGNF